MGLFKKKNDDSFSANSDRSSGSQGDSNAQTKPQSRFQFNSQPSGKTIISQNTMVEGNISTRDNIEVAGGIKGNLTTGKDATLSGIMEGDLRCDNAILENGKIRGNIKGSGSISIDSSSMAVGSLFSSSSLYCRGKLKGNIDTADAVALEADAMILGSITSSELSIQPGAMVKGKVEVIKNNVLNASMFKIEDEFMDIDIYKESLEKENEE